MEYLFIYLLQIVNVLFSTSIVVLCVSATALITAWIGYLVETTMTYSIPDKDAIATCGLIAKYSCIGLGISMLLFFIPTKQTMLLMGGTYLGKKAVNAVVTDEKIQKVDTIINLQLDKYIKELQRGN